MYYADTLDVVDMFVEHVSKVVGEVYQRLDYLTNKSLKIQGNSPAQFF